MATGTIEVATKIARLETKLDTICDTLLPQIREDTKEIKEKQDRLEQKFDDNHTELACVHTEIDGIEEKTGFNRKLILGFTIPIILALLGVIIKLAVGG